MVTRQMGLREVGSTEGAELQLQVGAKAEELAPIGRYTCERVQWMCLRNHVCMVVGVPSHMQTASQAWDGPEAWTQGCVPTGDTNRMLR